MKNIEDFSDEVRKELFSKSYRDTFEGVKKAHDDTHAIRKSTGMQYFTHPEAVAKVAIAYKGTNEEVNAAMAHDILEDTSMTFNELSKLIGEKATKLVKEVTNNPEVLKTYKDKYNDKGKEYYMNKKLVSISDSALFVKLCDILHNTLDNATPTTKERMKNNIIYLRDYREIPEHSLELFYSVCKALDVEITERVSVE